MKKLTIQKVKEFFEKNKYILVSNFYTNNSTKLNVICSKNHSWFVTYDNFKSGNRCPECSGTKKKSYEEIKQIFENENYTLLSKEYKNNKQKLHTLCSNGHEHFISYHSFSNGCRCSICAKNKKLTFEQVKKVFEEKNFYLIDQLYVNANTKLSVICPIKHTYSVTYSNFKNNTGGCPKCKPFKIKETCNKKYGVSNPSLIKGVRYKINKTCFNKYGTIYVLQNKEIALKQAKSSNNSYIKFHWKTNNELVCQGSYESRVIDYLNSNQIDFEWQPKTFAMPNSKTYRPDLYLIEKDVWVEIKGYMRGDAQIKWDWFKSEHPNSELWDKQKLKEMNIL